MCNVTSRCIYQQEELTCNNIDLYESFVVRKECVYCYGYLSTKHYVVFNEYWIPTICYETEVLLYFFSQTGDILQKFVSFLILKRMQLDKIWRMIIMLN